MDVRAVYLKGNEAFAACDYEQALSYFLSITDVNYNDESLLLKISQCYQELSKYDEAIEFLETLLNLSIERGNYKKAIAICKRILSIDPDDTEVILKLANIFRRLKQNGEASYYYKIVAQHYEYAGFMDKAIEMLQIIKELGQEGVEDLLEIVKKEYKRGAKSKVDQNIDSIIAELKSGGEYGLLDVALNLALTNSSENMSYINDLAGLYFKSGRIVSCLHLCLWGMRLSPSASPVFVMLVKSLWALGHDDLAKRLCESVLNGEWTLDDKNTKDTIKKIHTMITDFQKEKVRIEEQKMEQSVKEKLDQELEYLERSDFTSVDHAAIDHDLVIRDLEERIDGSAGQNTTIMDPKKKSKLSPSMLDGIRDAEILISEGLYDKANQRLFGMLEEEPGNPEVKALMDKAIKLSNSMDSVPVTNRAEPMDMTTDEMISELERYLDSKRTEHAVHDGSEDNEPVKDIIELFKSKIRDILMPEDYKTLFDLGIAYMELELWEEAANSFKKVSDHLSSRNDDPDKLTESKIYYAYASARGGRYSELDDSIKFLAEMLKEAAYDRYKLDVLYYLAVCQEMKGDINSARTSYHNIINIDPSYRDVDIRLAVIGK
jgi:tetratricopeptide (TPR) repeat protein